MDLDSVAGELYGLPPREFTPARDAWAGEARASGDRELAAAIKKLRRPGVGAWLVNSLVRTGPRNIEELLGLGDSMRGAQGSGAGAELRRLSKRRRDLVVSLTSLAGELAAATGEPLSTAVTRELEATLEAAVADPGAAQAVRSGRLTKALAYTGFGPVDLEDAVAAPGVAAAPAPAPAARRLVTDAKAAERSVADATAAEREAEREVASAERSVRAARQKLERAQAKMTPLERALAQAQAAEAEADRDLRLAEDQRREAQDALHRAAQATAAALEALNR